MPSIGDIIKQSHFEDPRHQVLINLMHSAMWTRTLGIQFLKDFNISWQQFNLMRILRGQKGKPVSMRTIAERMLDPQSNASRIVDKLVDKNYVTRVTCPSDRRQVRVALTDTGASLLEKASEAMKEAYSSHGGDLTNEEILLLSDLLDRFREPRV